MAFSLFGECNAYHKYISSMENLSRADAQQGESSKFMLKVIPKFIKYIKVLRKMCIFYGRQIKTSWGELLTVVTIVNICNSSVSACVHTCICACV